MSEPRNRFLDDTEEARPELQGEPGSRITVRPPLSGGGGEPRNRFSERPPAEMRSYDPSFSEWLGHRGADVMRAMGADAYNANKLGGIARDVTSLFPAAGAVISGVDTSHYLSHGDWTNAGISALGLLPGGKYLRESAQAARAAGKKVPEGEAMGLARNMPTAPSTSELFDKGDELFDAFRATTNMTWKPGPVDQLANTILTDFQKAGIYKEHVPELFHGVEKLKEKAQSGRNLTAADFDEFRQSLRFVAEAGGPAGAFATNAQSRLFDYLGQTGSTTLQNAVANWRAASKGLLVDTIVKKADIAPNAKGIETQTRVALNNPTKMRGWSEAEEEVLRTAREGGPIARAIDKTADWTTGRQFGLPGVGAYAVGGMNLANYLGPKAAAVIGSIPVAATVAATTISPALKRRAVVQGGDTVRQGSPMYRDILARDTPTYKIGSAPLPQAATPGQNLVGRNAIIQSLIQQQQNPYIEPAEGYR